MEDDSDDKDDSKRRTRNLSEKKRRDTFNILVNELSSMVSTTNRKMDKSTVLKSTISFLKTHNEITARSRAHDVHKDWKPSFLTNEEFMYLLLEALEGFIMVFSLSGRICYVSEGVASLLGHDPYDLLNKSIFDLAYEEDRPKLYNLLQNSAAANNPAHTINKENEVRFQCHLRRSTLDFRDETTYDLIQFIGHFRINTEHVPEDLSKFPQEQDTGVLFVCTGRLNTPQLIRNVSLVDSNRNEFTSRHSLEWKYLFLDHRAPPIIGYLPFEVLGTSGYDYYHFDDLEKVVTCHEELMQKGELTSCYYRFLTKGQQWIWLQTRFYITYHQWNSKPEFVVCTHRVVSYADVAMSIKQENAEAEAMRETDANCDSMKDAPSEDAMTSLSPTYMSDAGDTFTGSYQPLSQPASVKSVSASSTSGTMTTVGTAAGTAAASWSCASHLRYATGSDAASVSGESRSSQPQRNSSHEVKRPPPPADSDCSRNAVMTQESFHGSGHGNTMMFPQAHKTPAPALVPQHGIGAQYLEPAPYVGAVGVQGVLPVGIPPLPVIVTPDQAQMQLQRKHEELQQMIMRQQEELRQVKEQLLLARLGILQPLINAPNATYLTAEEMQHNQRVSTQILYDATQGHAASGYQEQDPPNSTGDNQNMPQ